MFCIISVLACVFAVLLCAAICTIVVLVLILRRLKKDQHSTLQVEAHATYTNTPNTTTFTKRTREDGHIYTVPDDAEYESLSAASVYTEEYMEPNNQLNSHQGAANA